MVIKLIINRWAGGCGYLSWWSRSKLNTEGGIHGNPQAATARHHHTEIVRQVEYLPTTTYQNLKRTKGRVSWAKRKLASELAEQMTLCEWQQASDYVSRVTRCPCKWLLATPRCVTADQHWFQVNFAYELKAICIVHSSLKIDWVFKLSVKVFLVKYIQSCTIGQDFYSLTDIRASCKFPMFFCCCCSIWVWL